MIQRILDIRALTISLVSTIKLRMTGSLCFSSTVTESSVYLKKYEGRVQLHCDQSEEQQQSKRNEISEEAKTSTRTAVVPSQQLEERAKITTSNSNLNEYDVNLSLRDRVNLAVRKTMEDNNDHQNHNQQPTIGVVR